MAKRFYDTNLINQEWYMGLAPKHKALYMHLLCSCDVAGVFEVNYRLMSAYINDDITESDVFETFGKRVVPLVGKGTKGILVDFVSFQCGGELNPKVKAHISIIKRLNELGMTPDDLNNICTHKFLYNPNHATDTVSEPKQKVAANVKPDTSSNIEYDMMFERLWSEYPRHDSKKLAKTKFFTLMKKVKDYADRQMLLGNMISAIQTSRNSEQWMKQNGQFIPMLTTWLNQARWEDEGIKNIEDENKNAMQKKTLTSAISNAFKF
jgi:hypothetical protein